MGLLGFLESIKGISPTPAKSLEVAKNKSHNNAFTKAMRQPPELLEAEFILDLAKAFNEMMPKQIKPNLYAFNCMDGKCPAQLNMIIAPSGSSPSSPRRDSPIDDFVPPLPQPSFSRKDFEIIRMLGQSNQGKTFLGFNTVTETYDAIKIVPKAGLSNDAQSLIRREHRLLSALGDNPWTVGLKGSFEDTRNLYFVTEYCAGGDLGARLRYCGSLTDCAARLVAAELLVAIEALHSRGIIHGDIKPENILIDANGHIVIIGFKHITSRGRKVLDVPWYASGNSYSRHSMPSTASEARNARTVASGSTATYEADIYDMGVVLHYLFYAELPDRPHQSSHAAHAGLRNLNLDFSRFTKFWPAAEDLLTRMLEQDPYKRATIAELKGHPFFHRIDWGLTAARLNTEAHKQKVFYFVPPMYINTWDVPPAGEPLSPEMPPTRMLKHVGLPPPAAPKHKVPIRSIRRVGPRIAKLSPYDPFIRPVLHAPRFPTPAYHTTNSHTILTISSLSHYSSSSSPSQYSSSSYASSLSSFDSVPKTPELENGEYFDIRIHTWSTVCGTKHKQDPINQPTNSPLKSRWSDPSLAEVPLTPSTELHAPILGRLGTWSRAHTPHPRVETEGSWSHRLRTCSSVLWRAVCVLLG